LPLTGGHPFYQRLNQVLDAHAFDEFVEAQSAPFYAETMGRPSLTPGTYFRLLLIGYFEGIDSERGIAWRAADSLALRGFLGLGLDQIAPEHSTISRTRRLIDVETHRAVFMWILQILATANLVKGKTIGIDATTLEANAALRSIVRRDSGETYEEFLTRLAEASGIDTPTRADLARLDRKRQKKGSNKEWRHPHDPDARITKMKDGRTHLAHKAEHAVDMETGAIVGVTIQRADQGDTTTIAETVTAAAEDLEAVAGGDRRRDGCDRRTGGRQGVPQQSGTRRFSRPRSPDVHRGTGPGSTGVEEEGDRPRRRPCESTTDPRRARAALVTATH
jgi:transposase